MGNFDSPWMLGGRQVRLLPGHVRTAGADGATLEGMDEQRKYPKDVYMANGKQKDFVDGTSFSHIDQWRELEYSIRSTASREGNQTAARFRAAGIAIIVACCIAAPIVATMTFVYVTDTNKVVSETEERLSSVQEWRDAVIVEDMGRRNAQYTLQQLRDIQEHPELLDDRIKSAERALKSFKE